MKLRRDRPEAERRARSRGERGIALLLVLTLVVMFTTFVVDFSYGARIRYIQASRARDAAKAEYLAKSGLRMYQLLLIMGDSAQGRAESLPIPPLLKAFLSSGSMVVRLIPVLDTGLLRMIAGAPMAEGEEEAPPVGAAEPGQAEVKAPTRVEENAPVPSGSFLDFDGDFAVTAKEEASKISLRALAKFGKLDVGPAALLLQALKREEYQPLFRAANLMPEELLSNIIDWADPNGERANGQGYEDNLYNRSEDPYQSKNSPYDTVSELHLVAGMNDSLFAVIAPLVTPFTDADGIALPLSGDSAGQDLFCALIGHARNRVPTQADCTKWWTDYQRYQIESMIGPPDNAQGLITALQAIGISDIDQAKIKAQVTEGKKRPKQFTLTATGRVGDVQRTVQTVIDISKNRHNGGLLLYWRVE